jgi:hypothetical protein
VSLVATVLLDTLVQIVHLDIAGVNQAFAGHGFNEKAVGVHVGVGQVFINSGLTVSVTLEIGNRLVYEVKVTEGRHW